MVRSFGLVFQSNQVSIPATGRYCLATLMSSDRHETDLSVDDYIYICVYYTIYIYIYILYIYIYIYIYA